MIPITYLMPVYNEAQRIGHVLRHVVQWADEILIIDKSSTDNTKEICSSFSEKVRVVCVPFSRRGEDDFRNYFDRAMNDWIYIGTASEIPTRKLIETVHKTLDQSEGKLDLIHVPRKMYSFGINSKLSPWYVSPYPFLINRKQTIVTNKVHNHFLPKDPGNTAMIPFAEDCCVHHFTHSSAKEYVETMLEYFELEAAGASDVWPEIDSCFQNIGRFESQLRAAGEPLFGHFCAWNIYWLGKALFLWQKQRGVDVKQLYHETKEKILQQEWFADRLPKAVPQNAGTESHPLISICVITNSGVQGREERKAYLDRLIRSTSLADFPEGKYEIIVIGAVGREIAGARVIEIPEAAATGNVCLMRNAAVKAARGEILIQCDDDVLFTRGYWSAVSQALNADADILCTRLLNPNGTRYWDWAAYVPGKGLMLLPYDTDHEFVYATGGHGIYRRQVFEKIHWNEQISHGQNEEFQLAADAREAGLKFGLRKEATVFLQYHHCDASAVIEGRVQRAEDNRCDLFRTSLQSLGTAGDEIANTEIDPIAGRIGYKFSPAAQSGTAQIEVSILTCCSRFLQRLRIFAQSILKQNYDLSRVELVIANPASPDGVSSFIRTLQQSGTRLNIKEVLIDAGHYRNRGLMIQEAFKNSRGQIAIGMDCDLILPPQFLNTMLSALQQNSKLVAGVYRNFLTPKTTAAILSGIADPISEFETFAREDQEEERGYRGVLGYCQATSRENWEAVGYPTEFDEISKSDVAFVERLAKIGVTPLFLKDLRVLHLNHDRNWMGTADFL